MPNEIYEALLEYIEEYNLDCADNFRYSPKNDPEGMDEYLTISQRGCCGRADFLAWENNGQEWVIGCNYGH